MATHETSDDRFEIAYANGKFDFAATIQKAELKVALEARDLNDDRLFPATIRSCVPEVIGVGEIVMTMTADDAKASRHAAPTSTNSSGSLS